MAGWHTAATDPCHRRNGFVVWCGMGVLSLRRRSILEESFKPLTMVNDFKPILEFITCTPALSRYEVRASLLRRGCTVASASQTTV